MFDRHPYVRLRIKLGLNEFPVVHLCHPRPAELTQMAYDYISLSFPAISCILFILCVLAAGLYDLGKDYKMTLSNAAGLLFLPSRVSLYFIHRALLVNK